MGSANRDGDKYETVDGSNSKSWLAYFGEELRLARELRQMSVRQLASHTSYSYQQVSNVEAGRRTPSEPFANEVDAALDTGGRFSRILRRVLADALPDWFQGAAREEAQAVRVRTYQSQVVHGLLQTEAYARALLRAGRPRDSTERIEALLAGRLSRQLVLASEAPPFLWAILDEAVLRRPVGGPAVMAEQLEELLKQAQNPNVMIQILPFAAGAHVATDGSFTLWSYQERPDVLYVEGLLSANLVERAVSLESARLSYDLLQAASLPGEHSADLIRDALKGYTT
ncbi:helix-turn-helix domain-containing protein [Actinacidiphila bryophytorum]|uniref:Helix-turn-helix domain-containing protein n=1 Tax=Actinacidiphila bryophytorum TaxID=1436133 RepID=A0A9W4E6C5_9ACTN|nr:helix-turn-helix transcriptional regulator [Actinacidiphila bryophytorum]MBM9434763.1 helix-turn-helix transcriptional regulator [Actinacidiphila bryophytorum]MBN6546247.1 helix-turn-helix transcriptional regulator [Actinacidiphila bryophytorum]CAG7629841.1 Helix-turn-helix domain-containing protein [Actinacidiphila bryophytorum]